MSKFEQSNDNIPADEMTVAKLVQNAMARNLEWCKNTLYKTPGYPNGERYVPDTTYACCAVGAALLEKDTRAITSEIDPNGNDEAAYDSHPYAIAENGEFPSAYMIGAGYRCAMK
jgi:hypothetical protein